MRRHTDSADNMASEIMRKADRHEHNGMLTVRLASLSTSAGACDVSLKVNEVNTFLKRTKFSNFAKWITSRQRWNEFDLNHGATALIWDLMCQLSSQGFNNT